MQCFTWSDSYSLHGAAWNCYAVFHLVRLVFLAWCCVESLCSVSLGPISILDLDHDEPSHALVSIHDLIRLHTSRNIRAIAKTVGILGTSVSILA